MIHQQNDLNQRLIPTHQQATNSQSEPKGAEGAETSQDTIRFLRKLEGECRVNSYCLLRVSYVKAVFLGLPCALTIIGLVLLYRLKALRCALLFERLQPENISSATHLMVKGSSNIDAVCKVRRKQWKEKTVAVFFFEELLYQIGPNWVLPLGMRAKEEIGQWFGRQYQSRGLSAEAAEARLQFYGRNQHLVKIPSYFEFIFNIFFLWLFSYIQYFTFFIYLLQGVLFYGIELIGANFITSSINYFLIKTSFLKIKQIAEKKHKVSILRSGEWITIDSDSIAPGDLYRPSEQIACDSIVVSGDLFVSEVGFTGESIPVGKFALTDPQRTYESEHWVFEGSEVVSMKANCVVMAVNTGYSTRKGRIIRKILYPKNETSQLFKSFMLQVIIILIVSIAIYFAFYHYMFDTVEQESIPYLILASFIIQSIPTALPVFINTSYAIILARLRLKGIIGLKQEKTTESSRLETLCFDKTGTLTQNQMEIRDLFIPTVSSNSLSRVSISALPEQPILHRLFASCHSVQHFSGRLHGDEIDLQMFKAAQVVLNTEGVAAGTVFQVQGQHQNNVNMEVLRVHQFQSRFQSMSVVARNKNTNEVFVFVKGAPEKIHQASLVQFSRFAETIRELSLEGLRSIAVGFKRVGAEAAQNTREQCLEGISLLAVVTFANALKSDAASTIATLTAAKIKTKMITGDSIFVAVQTVLQLQMVPSNCRIIALEGSRIKADGGLRAIAVRKQGTKIVEQEFQIDDLGFRAFKDEFLAMDYQFLKQRQSIFLEYSPTVFARATPQAKAIIIKKQREKAQAAFDGRSLRNRIFGGSVRKVGMVGDGANDLMAIREADVGIGVCNSDAVYGSDFTITSLSQIPLIIRQGRAGESKLVQLASFMQAISFLFNVVSVLCTSDMAIIGFVPSLFKSFGLQYFTSFIIAYTPPAEQLSPFCPSFNLLGSEFLLSWWGSALINSGGMVVAYLYYQQSPDFVPNPNRNGLNGNNKTGTIIFIIFFLLMHLSYFGFSKAKPFKKPFYHNRPLLIFLIFSFCLITACCFLSSYLHFFNFEPIAFEQALTVYLICLGTGLLNFLYVRLIQSAQLYKEQFAEGKDGGARLKELTHSI